MMFRGSITLTDSETPITISPAFVCMRAHQQHEQIHREEEARVLTALGNASRNAPMNKRSRHNSNETILSALYRQRTQMVGNNLPQCSLRLPE
jgi:hypothetical protein